MGIVARMRQAPPSASGRLRHDWSLGIADAALSGLFALSAAVRKVAPLPEVDRAVFDRVRLLHDARAAQVRARRAAVATDTPAKLIAPQGRGLTLKYLLTGLARCGLCRSAMRPIPSHRVEKSGREYAYTHYACPRAGAGACAGAMLALALRRSPAAAVAVLPLAENALGGRSYRPGEVLRVGGTTVEVVDTDAEGRLVLADALAWTVARWRPRAVVDLATLTGSIVTALGHHHAGLFNNDPALAADVAAYVSPPPPPGTAPHDFLAAVVAARRERDGARLARDAAIRARLVGER